MSKTQVKVVKYFIKSSPVGEVKMVLGDVCNIIDDEILNNEDIKNALREYFESHRQHVKLPDGKIALVTEIGRQNIIEAAEEGGKPESFVYFDSKLGVKFSFDPLTLVATVQGSESDYPEQLDENWAEYKLGVQTAIDEYVDMRFKEGTTRASLCFNQNGQLQIDISCINLNHAAWWGGEWQSQWLIDTQASTMSGSVKINSHYYEAGNIQFNLEKVFENIPLAAANGPGIVSLIDKTETEYQKSVEETQDYIKDGLFKRMRRKLPVTGQKFDWENPKGMLI